VTREVDVEIELPACHCRVPHDVALAVQARFEAQDLRVSSRATPQAHELAVKRVRLLKVRFQQSHVAGEGYPGKPPEFVVHDDFLESGEEQRISTSLFQAAVLSEDQDGVVSDAPVFQLQPEWLPVFDVRTLIRTGVELLVFDDEDASRQLEFLAPALELPRDAITIKPRRGWHGYGVPIATR
jgi:hypothetical protein